MTGGCETHSQLYNVQISSETSKTVSNNKKYFNVLDYLDFGRVTGAGDNKATRRFKALSKDTATLLNANTALMNTKDMATYSNAVADARQVGSQSI